MIRSVILFICLSNTVSPIEGFGSVKNWVKRRLPLPVQTILRSTTDGGVSNPKQHTDIIKSIRTNASKGNGKSNELTVIPPKVENGPLAFLHLIKADVLFIQILKIVENFFLGLLKWLEDEDEQDMDDEGNDTAIYGGSRKQRVLKSRVYDGKCVVVILIDWLYDPLHA